VACRLQDNPISASSDGVPPELVVLGFRGVSVSSGLTGLRRTSLVRIVCDPRVLVLLCVDQNCVNIFWRLRWVEEIFIGSHGR